jgi:glycosyltransferase involved in cell wall biosynthesis
MSDRPLQIVQYLCRFRAQDGGVPRAVADLSEALRRRGHKATIVTWQDERYLGAWRDAGGGVLEIERPGSVRQGLTRASRDRLRDALSRSDVVHLHGVWDGVEADIAALCRRLEKPYLVTVHGMLDRWTLAQRAWKKQVFLRLRGRRMLEEAWAVHCTSKEEASQSEVRYPKGRSVVLPLLADLSAFECLPGAERARTRVGEGRPLLVYLGRLHPIKQIERLLEAAGALQARHPALRVAIAGGGESSYVENLRTCAARCGVGERVDWLGHIDGVEKVALLQLADVVVLPSRHENWGIALIEAMAAGAPVVTTRGVNIWREVDASGGAVVVGEEAVGLEEAIGGLLQEPAKLRAMGAAGRRWVMGSLGAERVVEEYEGVYREMAGRNMP